MVTRLSGGLTPGDGSDPRTFPSIWNETADTIESQGTAISGAESDIDTLQSDVTANGTAITGLQSDVSTLQSDVTAAESDIDTLQSDVTANGTAITGLQSDVSTLQSDVTAAESDIDDLEAKNIPSFGTATPSDGDVLTFDSGTSEYVPEAPATGGATRNLLYNGAMQVAQRGTSETGITGPGYYTADRWRTDVTNMGTWTQTVEADGPTGSGFTKSLKMECTTADGSPAAADLVNVQHRLEGQDLQGLKKGTSSAESLILSFYVKSNVTGTYIVEFLDVDNSRHIAAAYTIDSSGTWEQKSITLPGDTGGSGFANDNGLSFLPIFWLGAGSDRTSGTLATSWAARNNANGAVGQTNLAASTGNYWQVTGVQLETGTVATGFDHKPYGVELAECQRYYYRSQDGVSTAVYAIGTFTNATTFRVGYQYPNEMRTTPSFASSGNFQAAGAAGFSLSGLSLPRATSQSGEINATTTGATAGQAAMFRNNSDTTAYFELDAEL